MNALEQDSLQISKMFPKIGVFDLVVSAHESLNVSENVLKFRGRNVDNFCVKCENCITLYI